jgi:hypothetical protein
MSQALFPPLSSAGFKTYFMLPFIALGHAGPVASKSPKCQRTPYKISAHLMALELRRWIIKSPELNYTCGSLNVSELSLRALENVQRLFTENSNKL